MTRNSLQQKIGRRGEGRIRGMFEDEGYACAPIYPDFGEDFLVFGEDRESIEPFKLFVQVKASERVDARPSDWTEYVEPLKVRNWILSNELTVVVRCNLLSGETRYCIPEDECDYWEIDFHTDVPIRIDKPFTSQTVQELVWMARLRHYDRIIRLTRPNAFESHEHKEVPRFRLFIAEFLVRLHVLTLEGGLTEEALRLYLHLYERQKGFEDVVANRDMSRHEVIRYSACVEFMPLWLYRMSRLGNVGIRPFFADRCATLLVQFVIEAEKAGLLPIDVADL